MNDDLMKRLDKIEMQLAFVIGGLMTNAIVTALLFVTIIIRRLA
jgi:tetrahydromethanopterin S-methyltransferase subunit G